MTRHVKVATTQMQISRDAAANLVRGTAVEGTTLLRSTFHAEVEEFSHGAVAMAG
jgi:hypothetical protein